MPQAYCFTFLMKENTDAVTRGACQSSTFIKPTKIYTTSPCPQPMQHRAQMLAKREYEIWASEYGPVCPISSHTALDERTRQIRRASWPAPRSLPTLRFPCPAQVCVAPRRARLSRLMRLLILRQLESKSRSPAPAHNSKL